ncbi:acyltransferase family protein [Gaetbulibacter saemankumensis]|uniref:acyltransferase family protein n=1 Tax=Gaetbulibacter saemankumensis TaxID=311208 RepID=UPI002934E373|nr:heparan-alpha-glucosaminide N-acetyltransferase domain-containing protein [Gaetbulibacter saemankumensis]
MMKKRIESVDILRGLTIIAMVLVNTPGDWNNIYPPLRHAQWHGLTPTDLIFPFFLFIVGISIYFAYKNKTPNASTIKKISIRSLKLIGLGLFLNAFIPQMPFISDIETLRFPGVLQRIGIVFFVSALLYLNFSWKKLLAICVFILIGYWILLDFIPLPNGNVPTLDRSINNWANYIDLNILGNHMWQADYDPEGLLSTLTSIVSCLSGVLTAKVLDHYKSINFLIGIALVFLTLGYIWNFWFPINKAFWSSSFVLVTNGWATLLLAIIYYLKDIKNYKFGNIFKYVGMNAITIYFLSSLISKCMYLIPINNSQNIHSWLYENIFLHDFIIPEMSSLLYGLGVVAFYIFLAYLLYRKRIFIKV